MPGLNYAIVKYYSQDEYSEFFIVFEQALFFAIMIHLYAKKLQNLPVCRKFVKLLFDRSPTQPVSRVISQVV